MNRILYTFLAVALVGIQGGLAVSAQPFDRVYDRNLWNAGNNITGLRTDSVNISFAEAGAYYESGSFRGTDDASSLWGAGVVAKTIMHLSRFSMYGDFSFNHQHGYDMCGSLFIDPGYYPIDVYEFTPGRKTLQTYSLDGGIAADISPHWRIGGKMAFESDNYSKIKDIRHTNYRLDLAVLPGVMFHTGGFSAGMSLMYRKTSESIKAERIGTATADTYYAFLDKGLMYGAYEIWNGSGIHLTGDGVNNLPVKENEYGVFLQIAWLGLYVEGGYVHGRGLVGEKDYDWFVFPSDKVSARAGYRFHQGRNTHIVEAGCSWKRLCNYETIIDKVTEGGVTMPVIYGSNRIFFSKELDADLKYSFCSSFADVVVSAAYTLSNAQSTLVYPFVNSEKRHMMDIKAESIFHIGRFDLKCGAEIFYGKMTATSLNLNEGSGVTDEPYRHEALYNVKTEYGLAPRMALNGDLRYNIVGGILKGAYFSCGAKYLQASRLQYIQGWSRIYADIRCGYTF